MANDPGRNENVMNGPRPVAPRDGQPGTDAGSEDLGLAIYRVGVAKLAVPTLNAHFAAAVIADNILGRPLGFPLRVVHAAGALRIPRFHGPITSMLNNVAIVL